MKQSSQSISMRRDSGSLQWDDRDLCWQWYAKTNSFGFAIHRESTDYTDNLVGRNRDKKFVVSIEKLFQPSQVEKSIVSQ